jgi:Uma2 family endonuclease
MATVTESPPAESPPVESPPTKRCASVGPHEHGLAMDFDEFTEADFEEGWLYELARGIIVVTEVPGIHHGRIVGRFTVLFVSYELAHPGVINYRAGGGECRLRLPGMKCDRHPDQAIYLLPDPEGPGVWTRWVPQIVVEVVSASGEDRDYVEKREEYLRVGVLEYWILDPKRRRMLVLLRRGDTWEEHNLGEDGIHRTELLPGLEARVGELLGPRIDDETP